MISILGLAAVMVSVEQFWGKAGKEAEGSILEARHCLVLLDVIAFLPFLGLETSESVKTSPFIELTSEQGEQDLVPRNPRGKGGASNDWHLLGGNELVGDLLGTDVKIDPIGLLIISILCPD